MKRITTNDDIRFPIRVVKGLDSDVFTIQFYTTSRAVCLTKTNEDVVDGIIHLEWTELYPLGTGVMNYTVLIPEADGSYSDDTFNKSISGTTIFYIVSDIIVPDGDEAQELVEVVADLQTQVNANTAKIEELMKVTITSSNWSATALQTPDTRYIISGNLDFDSATEVEVGDNCQIEFTKGSTLGSNVELLINNAEIVAPLTQIFDGTKITGFFHNGQIPVEWFGAKGDGETDDAEAINTTIKYAGKSEVLLSAPIYVIGSTINIDETNANFDSYDGQVEEVVGEEGGKKFLCKGSIYSTSNFTGYKVGNVTVPAMIRLAASNATVRIEGAIVVHADLTNCIGFLHVGYHDNKVYIARVMKARDYIGMWSWLDGTTSYTNQALMNLGTCDGVVYIYAMGTDFECEQICGFNNAFMVSDKYAGAYAGVQQASFKFASLTANYGIRVKVGNNDGLIHPTTKGWMNACRIEYNGISGSNESRRFIPTTDATFIKVDSGTTTDHFCQNKIICNSVEPIWYKLMDINGGRGDYFEFLGNFGDCHVVPYRNGVPDDKNLGKSAPTLCYNGAYPYTSTNKFINISNSKDFLINNLTPFYPMPYDTIYVHNSSNIVFTNCQAAEYIKEHWYQYVESARRFEKVIFTCSDITDLTSTDITVFEPDSRETDTIAYVESANDIDLTVDRLNIVTTPAYTTKFNVYPLYQVINGVKSQLGYCYDYKGLIASNNTLEEALSHVVVDAYTKAETNTLLAGKADKNGSASEAFTINSLNLMREGAATTLYNYSNDSGEYVSFYDKTGGSLTYKFTANQGDNIATERQLNTKANSSDVYSKSEVYTKGEVNNLIPDLPDNIVTDANYVHTDNNFTTTLKNKLDGIASGAEVNVQANWNETNSSSDAYILNKPTVDSSITGSSQTNAVQGGAIYTALQGKAGYKQYNSKSDMEADTNVTEGTVGYDSDEEKFYIYNSASDEWKPIDETGGGESKIVLYAIVDEDDDTCTIQTTEYETLTCSAVKALLNDPTKDVVLRTHNPNDDPNYKEYRLYSYYDDTDYEMYDFFYSDGRYMYIIDLEATRSYTNTWDCYTSTYTIPTSPGSLGIGFGTQNNTSTSSVSATVNNYKKVAGGIVVIKFTKALAHAPQLNINSTGSSYIYFRGSFCPANTIQSGDIVTMVYTGSVYEILSITKNNSTDAAAVSWTGSNNTLQAGVNSYKTYAVQDYPTSPPAGYNTVKFRFAKNTSYNVEPVTTLILRAGNYSNIDWENMNVSFYSRISGTSTEVTIKWKDNDSPVNTLAHLGNGVDYVVIKVYEGEYGTYEAW